MDITFDTLKREIEYIFLPLMKDLPMVRRSNLRNQIRYCKTEEELKKVLLTLGKETKFLYTLSHLKEKIIPRVTLEELYEKIIKVLKKYCDLREEYYSLLTIWIIGTHFYREFPTYPELFINASKASGKSRLINLMSYLCWNGRVVNNISESVLFRTAGERTFLIDEIESIGAKDKQTLRELLNSAYKSGVIVERASKIKVGKDEKYGIEQFELYTPVVFANIWGIENTLFDRTIPIYLEKSANPNITDLLEMFKYDKDIIDIKGSFVTLDVSNLRCFNVLSDWNEYILLNNVCDVCSVCDDNNVSKVSSSSNNINNENYILFNKIKETKINSRHLELFFPLFIIASKINQKVFENLLESAKTIVKEKKDDDVYESRDVSLLDFLVFSDLKESYTSYDFIPMREITKRFKEFSGQEDDNKIMWITPDWIGKALKRLGLTIEKKRSVGGKGRESRINFEKARTKLSIYKEVPEKPKVEVEKTLFLGEEEVGE